MAVGKAEGGSFVGRAVEWVKGVGEKIKAAVAEYTSGSRYAKADKPPLEKFATLANPARPAAKFADKPQAFLTETKFVEIEPLPLEDLMAMRKPVGTYLQRYEIHHKFGDDAMREMLEEMVDNPNYTAEMKADIQKLLDRFNQTR